MLSGDCDVCINGKMPSYSDTCVECGLSRKNYKPITNADRLRSMSDEELAEWLVTVPMSHEEVCPNPMPKECRGGDRGTCIQCWLDWLKKEAHDEP